ncbi:MAG: acetoacetate decarboxylase family protein [Pseudomonadota bacterium]
MIDKIIPAIKIQIALLSFLFVLNTSLYAAESLFESDIFKNTNLTSHCHDSVASWELPSTHYYPYEGNRVLWIQARTSREALEALVPNPLKINSDNTIIFFIGRLNITQPSPDPYNEGGIVVPVTYIDNDSGAPKNSVFIPILYLNKNNPIIGGRVIYGANKYLAEINIIETENTVSATVKKSGVTLIDMKVTLHNQIIDSDTNQDSSGWIAVKCNSPSNIGHVKFETLSLANVSEQIIHELQTGDGQLSLGTSKSDPLADIPILEILSAGFQIESHVLRDSEVIHKYARD